MPPAGLLFLALLIAALQASCAAKQAQETSAPRRDLFEEAERNGEQITERILREEHVPRAERTEELERLENQNRARAAQKYRALLANKERLDPATVETTMLNLGHLLFEESLARYRQAMRAYDEGYRRYQLGYESEAPAELPRYDFRKAREAYREFLEAFPESEHRAEVLYNMAYSYEEEGDLDRAVAIYDDLALNASGTRFGPEVFMRLGEHSFETNQFERAIEYYEKILEYGDTPFYEKALFKIGWSHYARDRYAQAVEAFARLLDRYAPGEERTKGDLYQESLEILAKILSETGGAKALEDFLRQHQDPAYGLDLSIQLGKHFQETARYQEAIETYQEVLRTYPLASKAPSVEQSLIECLTTERRKAEADAIQESLVDRYGKGTAWAEANPDPLLREQVDAILWDALNGQILSRHRKARESKNPETFDRTIALYRKALAYFPDDERAYETRFRYAECLFESGRLAAAAEEYEKVAKKEAFSTYREKAAAKRIQCMETLRAKEQVDVDTMLAAYRDYVEAFPNKPKTPLLLFKQGEILYNASRFDEAQGFFRRVIEQYPGHPQVERAWLLEQEALFESGRYGELEKRTRELLEQPFPLTEAQRARTDHLLRFAQFEQARADQDAGSFREAAARYEQLVAEAPAVEIAPDSLFNAAVCYQQAGDKAKAASCFEQLVEAYPGSKHYTDALLAPLPYYEETEQWDRLLIHLEKLHQKDPENELARETLYKLAKRFHGRKDYDRARKIFDTYRRDYPDDTARRVEIAYLEAEMSEAKGDLETAIDGYRGFLQAYKRARAVDGTVEVDASYVARAKFRILDPKYAQYRSIRLTKPLRQNLARKQTLLDQLVAGYVDAARAGAGEFALAAAFRVGRVYEEFWTSLLESEVPAGLSEEERTAYAELLRQQAEPYREKAKGAYRVTLDKARDKGVYSYWVLKAYGHLAVLAPDEYPSLLRDALLWHETWSGKRSLVRTIDRSHPRAFPVERAAVLQARLDGILAGLQEDMKRGDLEEARIRQSVHGFLQLLGDEPTLHEVRFNLAILYEMTGEEGKARVEYEQCLKEDPRNSIARLNLGLIHLKAGRIREAERQFQELALLRPDYAGAYYLLGVCQRKRGALDEAASNLEKSISLLAQFLDPYVELGIVEMKRGKVAAARNAFMTVLQHPKASARVLRTLAYRLLELGLLDEAFQAYTRIIDDEKPLYEDWNNRGVVCLRRGDRRGARSDLSRALQQDPSRPQAQNNLGKVQVAERAYEQAANTFLEASRLDPSFRIALLNAAVVYGQYLEDDEKSMQYLQEYLDRGGTLQRELLERWLAGSRSDETKSVP